MKIQKLGFFLNIFASFFSIFSIVSKEFKFSKIFGTRSTFNTSFLKIIDFPHWVDVDIAHFQKNTQNVRKIKIYKKRSWGTKFET